MVNSAVIPLCGEIIMQSFRDVQALKKRGADTKRIMLPGNNCIEERELVEFYESSWFDTLRMYVLPSYTDDEMKRLITDQIPHCKQRLCKSGDIREFT